jgi:hypothetical protein
MLDACRQLLTVGSFSGAPMFHGPANRAGSADAQGAWLGPCRRGGRCAPGRVDAAALPAAAQDKGTPRTGGVAVKQNPLKDAYFGETHLHTGVSMDAFIGGNRLKTDGTVEPIDAPVDLKTGQFNTEKGSSELMAVWTDPHFDPAQQAYYYVRVLQLPTARWTLYDEIREGVKFADDVKRQIVERAWSSPIWHEVN